MNKKSMGIIIYLMVASGVLYAPKRDKILGPDLKFRSSQSKRAGHNLLSLVKDTQMESLQLRSAVEEDGSRDFAEPEISTNTFAQMSSLFVKKSKKNTATISFFGIVKTAVVAYAISEMIKPVQAQNNLIFAPGWRNDLAGYGASYQGQSEGAYRQEHWHEFVVKAVNAMNIALQSVNTISPIDQRMLNRYNYEPQSKSFFTDYKSLIGTVPYAKRIVMHQTQSSVYPRFSVYEEPLVTHLFQHIDLDSVLNLRPNERQEVERRAQLYMVKQRFNTYPSDNSYKQKLIQEVDKMTRDSGYMSEISKAVERFTEFKKWELEVAKRGLPGHFVSSNDCPSGDYKHCPHVKLPGLNCNWFGDIIDDEHEHHHHEHHIHPEKDEWEEWIHTARSSRLPRTPIVRIGR